MKLITSEPKPPTNMPFISLFTSFSHDYGNAIHILSSRFFFYKKLIVPFYCSHPDLCSLRVTSTMTHDHCVPPNVQSDMSDQESS